MAEGSFPFHIKHHPARLPYMWNEKSGRRKDATPNVTRVRSAHGAKLLKELREVEELAEGNDFRDLGEDYLADRGDLLTFTLNPTFKNKLETFDSITSGVELLSIRAAHDIGLGAVLVANVFVSHGKLKFFISKLEAYATEEKNLPFADQIERISEATLNALWTSKGPLPEVGKTVWWEVWIRRGKNEQTRSENFQSVLSESRRLHLDVQTSTLELPEHTVILLEADIGQLSSAFGILNCVAELREPKLATLSAPQPFVAPGTLSLLPPIPPVSDAPAVCIFDTGINNGHPYLETVCPANHATSWNPTWSAADDVGHGTAMAGLAAFGDLRLLRTGNEPFQATHWIEVR